ncbi:HAD family acid phosphatase [Swingsia samuiensis]|nr:HAD family acid phosphatase [Swingsia samuiensis]
MTVLCISTAYAKPPENISDVVSAAIAYHDSGAYQRDFADVVGQAQQWIKEQAGKVIKPAIVLDIDETTLSNWEELRANQFAYFPDGTCDHLPQGPCGVLSWERSGRSSAFPPMKALIDEAQRLNVSVFFVTGRHENERIITSDNLKKSGISHWDGLILRPMNSYTSAASYKAPVRASLEQKGYTIIANIGDQASDLAGGHAMKSFLLPNPFYRIP